MQTLQRENGELLKQAALLESKAKLGQPKSDHQETLRQECQRIASALSSLSATNQSLRKELDSVQSDERSSFEVLHHHLAETKRQCEDKMQRYEDDLGSLLVSWQQQQTQLDAWAHAIAAQQQELQAAQEETAEAKQQLTAQAQKADAVRLGEREKWEREEKSLRAQIEGLRGQLSAHTERTGDAQHMSGLRNGLLVREVEQIGEETDVLRDKVQRQSNFIDELSMEMKRVRKVIKLEPYTLNRKRMNPRCTPLLKVNSTSHSYPYLKYI